MPNQSKHELSELRVSPVITAHPTAVRRQTVLEHVDNVADLLARRAHAANSPSEVDEIDDRLRLEVLTLWQTAEEVLPRKDVSRFNQGLMELGSLVCTPKKPRCDACPVASLCAVFEAGLVESIPRSGPKTKFVSVTEAAVVVRKNGQILLRQCPEGQRWAGLWDFPRFEIDSEGPPLIQAELVAKTEQQTGVVVDPGPLLKTIKHGVTRYRITLDCYAARYRSGKIARNGGEKLRWARPDDLDAYPLSTTGRKLADFICGASRNRERL